ncbi:MAG: alpha/beta hydrolase fold domain-containing protein [Phycisphaeraceae bacterium JB051]
MSIYRILPAILLAILVSPLFAQQQQQRQRRLPEGVVAHRNLVYATVDEDRPMKLDLYKLDAATGNEPLVIWIHGGGWRNGSKNNVNPHMLRLVTQGYTVASIDYRLGGIQAHPNHIHDCNAAVRWLKAHANEYGYSVEKVGVAGSSAGGHLALLVGVGSDVPDLQGKVGEQLDQSSRVDAIVDFYGPSDLYALGQAKKRGPELGLTEAFGKTASPVHFLDRNDPPVLIFQGDADRVVVPQQSTLLDAKYKELGLDSTLHMLKGAGHGGRAFIDPRVFEHIKAFLDKHLKSQTQAE